MSSEAVEAVVEHITYTKGVLGVVVCTNEGVPIRDSFQQLDRSVAQSYASMAAELARQAAILFQPLKTEPTRKGGDDAAAAKGLSRKKSMSAAAAAEKIPIKEGSVEILRVRTLLHEVVIRSNGEFLLVVIQEPVD